MRPVLFCVLDHFSFTVLLSVVIVRLSVLSMIGFHCPVYCFGVANLVGVIDSLDPFAYPVFVVF